MTPTTETEQHAELTLAHRDFQKGLNTHAFFKVHNRALGEDMVQETFIKTWAYLVKGGKIDIMKAFLYHILNNLIVDQYRKHTTTSLDALREKGFEPSKNDSEQQNDAMDGKIAQGLLKRLPKKYQKIMDMKYVKELSMLQMSALTGQSKNAIGVQAFRGLAKLKLLYNRA